MPNSGVPHGHGVEMDDSVAWANIRDEWATHMWANRGHSHT